MPPVSKCILKDGALPDQVGAVRLITRNDGGIIEETLLELSDYSRRIVFSITKGEVPTLNAVAIIKVSEITGENKTYVEWISNFDVDGDSTMIVNWVTNDFFKPCLENLEKVLTA